MSRKNSQKSPGTNLEERDVIEDIYPLSPMQEGILFHALSGEQDVYFEHYQCTLVGDLDLPAFQRTWQRLTDRHAVLRTAFDWEDLDEPVQVVLRRVELPIAHHDWRHLPEAEQRQRLEALRMEDLERGFELDDPPLMRLTLVRTADRVHRLAWSFHHLLLDGWSSSLLLQEAFAVFDAMRRDEEPQLPPTRPYRDYIAWLKRQDPGRTEGFWRRQLAGFTRSTRLQIDGGGTGTAAGHRSQKLRIDAERTAALKAFARRHQLTLNTLLQGVWARILGTYGESDDVIFGVTVSGRPPQLRGVEKMVGLFINTLPLRVRLPPTEPLLTWLKRLRRLQVELQEFEHAPLAQVQRWSDVPQGEQLFDSLLGFENYPLGGEEQQGSLEIRDPRPTQQTNYPLNLAVLPGERLDLLLIYDVGRFEAATIEGLLEHLGTLLRSVTEDPERPLGRWSLLDSAARRQLLAPWHPAAATGEHWQPMPAAGPEDLSVYLLDRALEPVPVGLRGAVCLAGAGLPGGDLRGPRATAEQFLPDPFSATPGTRMARTGDLGRRTPEGDLERAGATGRRVWIGDHRLDLGEMEAALLADPAIDDVAVVERSSSSGPQLAAYLVTSGPWRPERLRTRLDGWPVVPAAWVPVARLPLLAGGEVDQKALARLEVIDDQLIGRWEENLGTLPGIDEVAVVARETAEPRSPYHVLDLLPDGQAAMDGVDEPLATAAEPGAAGDEAPAAAPGAPAIIHGPALELPAAAPTTLAGALERAAALQPERGIVYIQGDGSDTFQTYPELLEQAERLLAGLRALGLEPQDKVLFQLDVLEDFIAAFWASMLGGFVPVPLSIAPTYDQPNAAVTKLGNAWRMLDRPLVLCGRELAPAVRSLSDLLGLEGLRVEGVDDLRRHPPDRDRQACQPDDLALLLLTSGSTGLPKAVMQSHRALLTRSAAVGRNNGFVPEDVSLNWMPLDHVGGIVMFHLRDVYVGCRQIQAPTSTVLEDPLRWLDWIERFQATVTWAPNFAFGLVNDRADEIARRQWDLSSMRFILNGGEAIVAKTARTFLQMLRSHALPETAMKPAWGMSETCSGITYSHHFTVDSTRDENLFVEVGAPVPEASVRIVDAEDRVVSEGTVGRLQVKGPMITAGYYRNPELNEEVFTADGWFNTGDLGVLRDGQLSITGREKDVIIVHGVNYYSHEIEAVVEGVEGVEVSYTAACPVREAGSDTDELAIFFHTPSEEWDRRLELIEKIRQRVTEEIGLSPSHLIPVAKQDVPKTAIGKIQRPQLRQRFEAGELHDLLKQIDVSSGNAKTVPDWFFRRVWRRKRVPAVAGSLGAGLVYADPLGLGAELCRRLGRPDRPWVAVEAGTEFARLDRGRYRIAPGNGEHHRRLLRSLAEDGIAVEHVVHLWTYGDPGESGGPTAPEAARELGIYGLLHLVQALAEVGGEETPRSLLVVASHAQSVTSAEPVDPERALLLGLVKTVPQEMPWLSCRHLDLPPHEVAPNAGRIRRELAVPGGDREVAWRRGERRVAALERVDLCRETATEVPFEHGGMVLMTGGLGGIGQEIARYLLRKTRVRLLLVGRTPLGADNGRGAELAAALETLGESGGEVAYEAVDVADETRLRDVVAAAEARWQCRLSGAIHLAGVLRECLLAEEARDGVATVLEPKMAGTRALVGLLQDRPGSFLIGFSSINSFFGGATMGAYAAANSGLEGLFDALESRGGESPRGYCLAWSMWDEVGMSRGYQMKDLSRARGYETISPRRGLISFLAALRYDQRRLIVGLDGEKRHIRRFADSKHRGLEELAAFFTSHGEPPRLDQLPPVTDRFGTRSHCQLQPLPEMPRNEDGEVDRARLCNLTGAATATAGERTAPRSELERQLTEIWHQVLGADSTIGIDDNFFQLGGDSILSIQVSARAEEIGLQLTPQQIFRYPTVAELAAHAEPRDPQPAALEPVEGEVPLTPILSWFFERKIPDPHHFNMALIFAVRWRLDGGLLDQTMAQLVRHHDALRMRFARQDDGWRQWNVGPEALVPPIRIDLSGLPAVAWRRAVESTAGRLQTSLDLNTGPLLRVAWFDGGDDRQGRLLIVIHHLVVDGVSWRILLGDLQRIYQQLSRDEPAELPAKTTSFQRWAEHLSELARSDSLNPELRYWLAEPRRRVAVLPRDVAGVGAGTALLARTVTVAFDEEETRALLVDVYRAYRTRINDVLLTAVAVAFRRWTDRDELLIDLEGHGREELFDGVDVSRTVGWFTAMFPVLLVLPPQASEGEELKAVKEQLRQIPRRGVGFGLLRYLRDDPETAPLRQLPAAEVSFNYLGQTDRVLSDSGPFAKADEEIGPYSNPRVERSHLINVSGQVAGGRLEIHWTYSEAAHHRATIERLADDFRAALVALIAHCRSPEAFGYTPSDFPLAGLDQAQVDRLTSGRRGIEDVYPLAPMQEGMLFHALYSSDSSVYFDQLSCTLRGDFDLRAFEQAWRQLLARHSVLRTAFVWGGGLEETLQVVEEEVAVPLEQLDWRDLPPAEQGNRLERFLTADRGRGFELRRAPLLRLTVIRTGEDTSRLVWSSHHLLLDGWSRALLLKEVFTFYDEACRGEEVERTPVAPFRDHVAWLKRQDLAEAETFWRRQLGGFTTPTPLRIEGPAVPVPDSEDDDAGLHYEIEAAVTGSLRSLARHRRLTLNTLIQGAWGLLLSRYSSEEEVLFGTTVSGRPSELPGVETMVGLFINSLPLRLRAPSAEPLLPWLGRLQETLAEMRRHEHTPLSRVQRWSDVAGGRPLFDSLLVFENFPMDEAIPTIGGLEIRDVDLSDRTNYPLTVAVLPQEELGFDVMYDRRRFDQAAIRRLMGHLETLLRAMVENPNRSLGELPLMAAEEKKAVLSTARGKKRRSPQLRSLLKKTIDKRRTPV